VQHGIVTAAITGTYAQTATNKARAKKFADQICEAKYEFVPRTAQYPHTKTNAKLTSALDESFRFEVNYVLDVQAMKPHYRRGG
jgi:hypothetical protein